MACVCFRNGNADEHKRIKRHIQGSESEEIVEITQWQHRNEIVADVSIHVVRITGAELAPSRWSKLNEYEAIAAHFFGIGAHACCGWDMIQIAAPAAIIVIRHSSIAASDAWQEKNIDEREIASMRHSSL
jgi:hypothetical protein